MLEVKIIKIIQTLKEDYRPRFVIFYTKECLECYSRISTHFKLYPEIEYEGILCKSGKQALDMQLAVYVGIECTKNNSSVIILANDKDYDSVVYISSKIGYNVNRLSTSAMEELFCNAGY